MCSHVFDESRPILLVVHESVGWTFACGGRDHEDDDFHNVGVGHLIDRDPTLNECADLEPHSVAERASVEDPWVRKSLSAEDF